MNFNTKVQTYTQPFIQTQSVDWIHNVETTMTLEQIDAFSFPVTINDQEYQSSYVCSPFNALVTYSQDELIKIHHSLLRFALRIIVLSLDKLLKLGKINKNITINNFLIATNPYPNWQGKEAEQLITYLKNKHPNHAIMFRSLNEHSNEPLLHHLKKIGFELTPSRQVYIFDKKLNNYLKRNNTENDRRALAKSDYQIVSHEEIDSTDYAIIYKLYNQLYLDKYSKHNPQFSEKLLAYWHQNKLLTFIGLRDQEGILQGIVGLFETDQVITAPLVGYNTHLSKKKSLYRILIYLILEYSHSKNCCLNLSSGASQFKRLRGGQAFIEYTAIYLKHLPYYRQFTWKMVNRLLNWVFVPLLKKYQL